MQIRKFLRIAGGVFGAWLGLVYATVSVEINHAALLDIPLPEPSGGTLVYYLGFLAAGTFIGVLTCWTEHTWSGMAIGTVVGIAAVAFLPWKDALNPGSEASLTMTSILGAAWPAI